MPLSNLALLGLGVATTAAVVVATKKKPSTSKKRRGSRRPGGFKAPEQGTDTSTGAHPICRKYPGGFWHPNGIHLKGYPDGKGWSDADLAMAKDAVAKATTSIPPWTSIGAARKMSFDIVRGIIAAWCPAMELPTTRVTLDAYLDKKVSLTWMWMQLDPMVWARVIAAREAGLATG